MGLHVPTDNLQDVVMSKMMELVDYEDSKKDDQMWTDGSREGNPLADNQETLVRVLMNHLQPPLK